MGFIELRNPRPRRMPRRATGGMAPHAIAHTEYLPVPRKLPAVDLYSAVERRRTVREFGRLASDSLSAFLWHSARTQGAWTDSHGERRERRPSPSAGACHPHDLLVLQRARRSEWTAAFYSPQRHALDYFQPTAEALHGLIRVASAAVDPGDGIFVFMAGRAERTARYYENPESLIWRDAGAMLGVMSIVASGLGIAFCPLGLTGEPYVSRIAGSGTAGYGGFVLGSRPNLSRRRAT